MKNFMKKATTRRRLAMILATVLVIASIPFDWGGSSKVKAAEPVTHELNVTSFLSEKGWNVKNSIVTPGTYYEYFKVTGEIQAKGSKFDAISIEDSNYRDKANISFTVKGTAEVSILMQAASKRKSADMALKKVTNTEERINVVPKSYDNTITVADGIVTVAANSKSAPKVTVNYELEAGTYEIYRVSDNKPFINDIKVVETPVAKEPTSAPTTGGDTQETSSVQETSSTQESTATPTQATTAAPTQATTATPTQATTAAPTQATTATPTQATTAAPTQATTATPTQATTATPTQATTKAPETTTAQPTTAPTQAPTQKPTVPSTTPTVSPTQPTEPTQPTTPKESVKITKGEGWFESAYVEFNVLPGAAGYNVYVKKAADADDKYTKLDVQLLRCYKDSKDAPYYRADALGLANGSYVLKVVPFDKDKKELTAQSATTENLTVTSYDRTGFAWEGNGTSNGAYNSDGTLRSDAVVIYLSEDTKNTVTMDVVKDAKGNKETATGIQNIVNLYKKGYEKRPLDIRVVGTVTDMKTMEGGDFVISGSSATKRINCGITMEGVGEDATVRGWGLRLKNVSNVEIRNLATMLVDSAEGDNIGLQQDCDHVWVHNCDFFYGEAGGDADQAKGDGTLDTKKSTYITYSYNHFYDNGKCNLLGLSENTTEGLFITYHHNWYDHTDSRNPRVRYYTAHVYNNYYDGNAKYGIGSTSGSSIFAENNYFRNCKFPMLISMQGSDVFDESKQANDYGNMATFSSECGGIIKAFGNYMTGQQRFVSYADNNTEFDAYVASARDEKVPAAVKANMGVPSDTALKKGAAGNTYNNFDTAATMYKYTADSAETAKANVQKYAGRMNGGDFHWTFTEADDTSYAVNTALKEALRSYQSRMISKVTISGSQTSDNKTDDGKNNTDTPAADDDTKGEDTTKSDDTKGGNTNTPVVTGNTTHNFTENELTSAFFTISGNLTNVSGSYNGLSFTKALKMESKTSVTFTAPSAGKLIIVADGAAKIKIDGTKTDIGASKVLEVPVTAGAHEITKQDKVNVFLISYVSDNAEVTPSTPSKGEDTTKKDDTKATEATKKDDTKATEATKKDDTKPTEAAKAEETTQPNPSVPTAKDGYDKKSTSYSGAYTSLYNVADERFEKPVYVSVDGTATGAGTKESPLDLETAIQNATEGTAILLLEGTYKFDHQVTIPFGNNGSETNYKVLKASNGAKVTLDFSAQNYGDTATNPRGLQMEGNYWYVAGMTVYGAADNGIFVAGSHNVVERCVLQANRDTGLQISRRNSSLSDMKDWPAYNYIINCTSFDNADPATGENADGFAAKLTCGEGNVFDGCISHNNCDDGWDLYAKQATGSIGVVTIRNCVAFANGSLTDGTVNKNGDRNGFKLGGSNNKVPTPHWVFNSVAFNNGHDGFTDNGNGGALTVLNCTSYNNDISNFNFYRTLAGGKFENLLSATGKGTDKFIGTINNSITANSKKYYQVEKTENGTAVTNGQKLGTIVNDPFTSNAFESTKAPTISKNLDKELRNANGTITLNGFLISTGNYASMGAHYDVANQVLEVKTALLPEPEKPAEEETKSTEPSKEDEKTTEETKPATEPTKAAEETKPAAEPTKAAEETKPAAEPTKAAEETKPATQPTKSETKTVRDLEAKANVQNTELEVVLESDNNDLTEDMTLKMTEVTSGSTYEAIKNTYADAKVTVVDISVLLGNVPQHEFAKGIRVRLQVPTGYNLANTKVYRMEADGSATDMNATFENGMAIFITNHFSTYFMVDTTNAQAKTDDSKVAANNTTDKTNTVNTSNTAGSAAEQSKAVQTGDNSFAWFYAILLMVSVAGVVVFARRKTDTQ